MPVCRFSSSNGAAFARTSRDVSSTDARIVRCRVCCNPREFTLFKKIDHVEIVTNQPEKTEAFYTGVLGFKLKFRDRVPLPDAGGSLDIVYLDLGGTAVELLTYKGVLVEPSPQN